MAAAPAAPLPAQGSRSQDAKSTFKVLKSLGQGSYGKVYKVKRTNDEQCYALKETDLNAMPQEERMNCVNEIRLLVSIKHPNVIGYHEAFLHGSKLCVVMEYAPFGDLRYYITKASKLQSPFPEEAIWRIFLQLAKGLSALHGEKIIHRDIKPANIFLCANDLLKIGDLGVSKVLKNSQYTRTLIGTPIYMAPEVWADRPYSYSSDMWSVGCVLYEMMTLQVPFTASNRAELGMRIRAGRYRPVPAGSYSPELISFCHALLSLDPRRRPTANEILSHAASAKWLRVLPTPPTVRRHSENGSAQGLGRMRGPSCSGSGLMDTIMVPRDLRQLPKMLPPPSYDSDVDAASDQPSRCPTPSSGAPTPRSAAPSPTPGSAARPPALQLPRLPPAPVSQNPSPMAAVPPRPRVHRQSEPGCAMPPAAYPQRPQSAVMEARPHALPSLPSQPSRSPIESPIPGHPQQLRVPSYPLQPIVPPRRVSYS